MKPESTVETYYLGANLGVHLTVRRNEYGHVTEVLFPETKFTGVLHHPNDTLGNSLESYMHNIQRFIDDFREANS